MGTICVYIPYTIRKRRYEEVNFVLLVKSVKRNLLKRFSVLYLIHKLIARLPFHETAYYYWLYYLMDCIYIVQTGTCRFGD